VRRKKPYSFALFVLCVGWATLTHGTEDIRFQAWRCPDNGGINVLYCHLRANGVCCEYSELLKEQIQEIGARQHTTATLAHLAGRHGLPLQPVSLTVAELSKSPRPVIVHMDGESPETGAFLLILSMTGQDIDYVNGPSAAVHRMSLGSFRRAWSGIALLPQANLWKHPAFAASGFTIGLTFPLMCRFIQARRFL